MVPSMRGMSDPPRRVAGKSRIRGAGGHRHALAPPRATSGARRAPWRERRMPVKASKVRAARTVAAPAAKPATPSFLERLVVGWIFDAPSPDDAVQSLRHLAANIDGGGYGDFALLWLSREKEMRTLRRHVARLARPKATCRDGERAASAAETFLKRAEKSGWTLLVPKAECFYYTLAGLEDLVDQRAWPDEDNGADDRFIVAQGNARYVVDVLDHEIRLAADKASPRKRQRGAGRPEARFWQMGCQALAAYGMPSAAITNALMPTSVARNRHRPAIRTAVARRCDLLAALHHRRQGILDGSRQHWGGDDEAPLSDDDANVLVARLTAAIARLEAIPARIQK